MLRLLAPLLILLAATVTNAAERGEPPVRAPFEGIDTLCVNDWWNREPSPIVETRVPRDEVIAFGIYTTHGGVVKLSAQLFPLYPDESREVTLEVQRDGDWQEVGRQEVDDIGWCTTFRVEDWDASRDARYRLSHPDGSTYEGFVRRDPVDQSEITVAALSCNSNRDRGMRPNYVRNINHQDPDLVFFAGDQSYDHKEHTAAWLKFGLQFREVFRKRPCVTIPDDHDIGQGNLWGEGGKKAGSMAGDDGGYFFHPEYIRMVERAQCGHLPDPFDPTPIKRGIGVYYTCLRVGSVDFAIIEDRKFKTGPKGRVPKLGKRPDLIMKKGFDPAKLDQKWFKLLGERQHVFLKQWGQKRSSAMRCVLSQTGFAQAAHLTGGNAEKNRVLADLDSNGWPQSGRNAALRLIRAAGAVHIGGDQHITTLVQNGIDEYRDGPWSFLVPAIVNNYWSRSWKPLGEVPGENRDPANPLPWTGDYRDGFDNRLTMHAYANPGSPSNGAGYGLVRFDTTKQTVTFECWPRNADVTKPDAKQFIGWPKTVSLDN
ncbi:MAG: metallophosphoesterase family protein [Planctomycetota bacterium]